MYAYALPTPTFTTAWGHYSRLSSPIGGGIARGNRGDGSSSTFDDGWRVARPGTDTTDARSEFAFSSPFRSPQPRINHSGSLLADLWKWGGSGGRMRDRVSSLSAPPCPSSFWGMFIAISRLWGAGFCRCSRDVEWPRWGFSGDCCGRS